VSAEQFFGPNENGTFLRDINRTKSQEHTAWCTAFRFHQTWQVCDEPVRRSIDSVTKTRIRLDPSDDTERIHCDGT
jgi:hypothetical protein